MTTLIVSDVHLGSGSNRAGELASLLARRSFGRLIILGDLFDRPRTMMLNESEWDLMDAIRGLSPRKEIIWVEGNHDEGFGDVISSTLGIRAEKEYEWTGRGKRFLALHGHQFDPYTTSGSYAASCAGLIYGMLRRIDNLACTDLFHRLCFESRSWKRSSGMVKESALGYARQRGADVMFCGHTHRAERDMRNGVEYVNTGCWSDLYCHYAVVGENGALLKEFVPESGVPGSRVGLTINRANVT